MYEEDETLWKSFMPSVEQLNEFEIQQIQAMAFDFFSAYKMGDRFRCDRIFQIILDIVENKPEIMSLQDYFGGKKITRFKGNIHMKMASKYISYVTSEVRKMMDIRVHSTPIE